MSDQKRSSGESFAGNVMKYSVATYLGFAITGLALIVKGLLPAEVLGAPVTFMAAPGRALCRCCSSTRRCICWCAT